MVQKQSCTGCVLSFTLRGRIQIGSDERVKTDFGLETREIHEFFDVLRQVMKNDVLRAVS